MVTLCMRCHAIKTTVIERKWLRGDAMGMAQYREALALPSARELRPGQREKGLSE